MNHLFFNSVKTPILDLLSHAYENCPYYSNILHEHLQTGSETFDYACFKRIPLLDKKTLVENAAVIRNSNAPEDENVYTVFTSGTTGFPLRYDRSQRDRILEGIILNESRQSFGVARNAIVAMFGLHREPFEYQYHRNQRKLISLSLHDIDETRLYMYYYALKEFKPDVLQGYASVLYELARFIESKSLEPLSLTLVENRSEHLQSSQTDVIEKQLGPLSDMYGATELYPIAYSCKYRRLHVSQKSVFLEIIDPATGKAVPIGESGEVVVTSLTNRYMPIVRYRLGDRARIVQELCPCGESSHLVLEIGRVHDRIVMPNGYILNSVVLRRLFDHFCDAEFEGIGEVQFVQEDPETFIVNLVEKHEHGNARLKENIVDLVVKSLGYPAKVTVMPCDQLLRDERTGKCQPFVSYVK